MESHDPGLPDSSQADMHGADDGRSSVARHPLRNDAIPATSPKPAIHIWNPVRHLQVGQNGTIHHLKIDRVQVTLHR